MNRTSGQSNRRSYKPGNDIGRRRSHGCFKAKSTIWLEESNLYGELENGTSGKDQNKKCADKHSISLE
jgi:hypothetical protein